MKFTDDQQKVIDLRDKNILVSAAAGSGKTAVLTERIADLVCGPDVEMGSDAEIPDEEKKNIERILIVTFTEAAAREMRERIGKRLRERLEKRPSDSYIRRQILLLPTAHITTIDSFCLYILRNHFEDIGLDPSFKIADDGDKKTILDAAFDETVAKFLEEDSESFKFILECFAPKGQTSDLRKIIYRLNDKAGSKPYPYEWLSSLRNEPVNALEEATFYEFTVKYENDLIDIALKCEEKAAELAQSSNLDKYYSLIAEEKSFLECVRGKDNFDERSATVKTYSKERLPIYRNLSFEDEEIKNRVCGNINHARDIIKKLQDFYYDDAQTNVRHINENINLANGLLDFETAFLANFDRMKREANVIDFTDMEHLALDILVRKENGEIQPTETALLYRRFFEEIMIDEYQDSNDVQETILGVISRKDDKGNRFMVGDVKQSIYGFRMAKPELFTEKYETYSFDGNERDVKVCLSSNFRSRQEVIDSVNAVFSKVMMKQIGGIDYTDDQKLVYGKKDYPKTDSNYKTEVLYFNKDDKGEESKVAVEARIVGNKIKELISSELKVIGNPKTMEQRPVRFKDIAILLRSTDKRDTVYRDELKKMGIPAYVISKAGYFTAPEVRLILNFLTIIDNPRQDLPLLSVLHSIIGGFTDEQIAVIRTDDRNTRLFESIRRYGKEGADTEIKKKCVDFTDKLENLRKEAAYKTAAEMIDEIYEDYDYISRNESLPNGEQRFANIKLLLDTAAELEGRGLFGLHDFVKAVEDMRKKDLDNGEANILDEEADVVKIMTIHKSKGLEYPVCFVSSLGTTFHSNTETVMADDEFGLGTDGYNLERRTKSESMLKKAISLKLENDVRGEELRVLYVALTRAREKLIMTGYYDKDASTDSGEVTPSDIREAKNFMDIVALIAGSDKELFEMRRVTPEESADSSEADKDCDRSDRIRKLIHFTSDRTFEPFVYPHSSLDGLFTKTTVSELKKAAYLERDDGENTLYHDEEKKIPKFISETSEEIGGARRGTAYHRVMELADFASVYDNDVKTNISRRRKECVESLFISEEDDKLVSEAKLLKFFNTDLARRMSAAARKGCLWLEQPFVLSVNANKVRETLPSDEKVLVQGVVDVYFEEDGELVLMDYKTDRVDSGEELIRRYKTQLDYYAEALSRLEKKPVKEIFIYSFALDEVIRL